MGKYILLDLDGTLTDTAELKFKLLKDGIMETKPQKIPLIKGSQEFVKNLISLGHIPMIVSDSHPKYVEPIATELFGIPFLPLADKPNILKTKKFLKSLNVPEPYKDSCLVIGDTNLDIELARGLNCVSVLTVFYETNEKQERDGIGDIFRHLKTGPTYVRRTFESILAVLENPTENLLAVEAAFQNQKSSRSRRFYSEESNGVHTSFRSLGRQNLGECDIYAVAEKYHEFHRENRTEELMKNLASAINNNIERIIEDAEKAGYNWDLITYVPDKKTTSPPNKMSELFDLLSEPVKKAKVFKWSENVEGSIKNKKTRTEREAFVAEYLIVDPDVDVKDKNIVIIDDQYTTGGTAEAMAKMLRKLNARHVIVITLFHLITQVNSERACPDCGKQLTIKINRTSGQRFLSCPIPRFGGSGCGHTEPI